MANLNDFKIIKAKSAKMFQFLEIDSDVELTDVQKERFGFYHLALEGVLGMVDLEGENYTIIDGDYNKIIAQKAVNDYGMDVVSIIDNSAGEIDIRLFNFKYREKFNSDITQSENAISRSTKFLEYIIADKKLDESINETVHKLINKIIDILNDDKICNIYLYIVSNEANGFSHESNQYISILEKNYGMKVESISLNEIVSFFDERRENRKSKFMINDTDFLSFQSDEKSTHKSYILKLSLLDLIRITSTNDELASKHALENDDELNDVSLDLSLLYDNVRGFLGDTKYNKNIVATLNKNHNYFFMYNNGITITAEEIECDSKNSGKKYLFTIGNFQIVNGGQTIRSVYKFLNDNSQTDVTIKLRGAYVLLRIFKINKNDDLKNSIAEYTNSQNAISDIDLKSIDSVQIQIETYLSSFGILYARKAGDVGLDDNNYLSRMPMEKMAQLLYSVMGYPDRASNQKRRLFQEYYNEIFKSDSFSLEKCKLIVDLYISIQNDYKSTQFKVTEQKIFYVLYISEFCKYDISTAIKKLEEILAAYPEDLTDSRKLIQKGFKDFLDGELNKNDQFIKGVDHTLSSMEQPNDQT